MSATDDSEDTECPTCGRDDFASVAGMKTHHAKTHGESIAGVKVTCDVCGDSFRRRQSHIDRHEHTLCSWECRSRCEGASASGKEHGQWSGGGESKTCEQCGENYIVKTAEAEESRFCSSECLSAWQAENWTGQDHPRWSGGYNKTQALRKQLGEKSWSQIRRDHISDKCASCGAESELQLHHIVPIRSGGTHGAWNLMTLCVSCHATVERKTDEIVQYDLFSNETGSEQSPADRGG